MGNPNIIFCLARFLSDSRQRRLDRASNQVIIFSCRVLIYLRFRSRWKI
ncbi:protein of unassigned function [Methylobacterium oryzae CBMB20]|uniref:Protein of unassigned function n=1 Tax=Methylobacterium oryzae CBMB20 TaxID=693986 RepID=A0A089NNT0_9HYPH|nr:protein of unassigned function [Methylobacterium oryzae CBMB20]